MKNILKKIVFVLPIVLSGCAEKPGEQTATGWVSQGLLAYTKVITVRGHSYIIVDMHHGGGIVHDEACECRKPKGVKNEKEDNN